MKNLVYKTFSFIKVTKRVFEGTDQQTPVFMRPLSWPLSQIGAVVFNYVNNDNTLINAITVLFLHSRKNKTLFLTDNQTSSVDPLSKCCSCLEDLSIINKITRHYFLNNQIYILWSQSNFSTPIIVGLLNKNYFL